MAPPKGTNTGSKASNNGSKGLAIGVVALAVLGIGYLATRGGTTSNTGSVQVQTAQKLPPVQVCKVFIENSGSMDGYVAPANSQLKTDLNALVSAINKDSLALHYINSNVIPLKDSIVSTFTEGLNAQSFRRAGGNRGNTSLQEILERVQADTKPGEVSILVSDMILDLQSGQSPESVSVNIETALRIQLEARPEWSVAVWRMMSDYEGNYYHTKGVRPVPLSGVKRPYFIFFMGDRKDLRSVLSEGQIPANSPLFTNRTHDLVLEPSLSAVDYHLAPKAVLGTLHLDASDSKSRTISEAERGDAPSGQRGFAYEYVYQRPELLQSRESLLQAGNYSLSPGHYSVERVYTPDEGKTFKVRVSASSVQRGEFSLHYRQPMPSWFSSIHSEQNENIHAEGAIAQTYGIRYILEGIRRPYETKAAHLISMPIRIK